MLARLENASTSAARKKFISPTQLVVCFENRIYGLRFPVSEKWLENKVDEGGSSCWVVELTGTNAILRFTLKYHTKKRGRAIESLDSFCRGKKNIVSSTRCLWQLHLQYLTLKISDFLVISLWSRFQPRYVFLEMRDLSSRSFTSSISSAKKEKANNSRTL